MKNLYNLGKMTIFSRLVFLEMGWSMTLFSLEQTTKNLYCLKAHTNFKFISQPGHDL